MAPASYLLMRGFDSLFQSNADFLDEREPLHRLQVGAPPARIDHIGAGIDRSALRVEHHSPQSFG
jgi:hypothetical protein